MTYTTEEIEAALVEGVENWITILIENKMVALGVDTEKSDPLFIERFSEELWPETMKAVLNYLMETQSPAGSWEISYANEEGRQQFSIDATFRMGEAIL